MMPDLSAFSGKTIFVAPLDWGLGHATRCVPLVRDLLKNNKVILGVTPLTQLIFSEEFPTLKQVSLPAYNISYSNIFPLWLKLLFSWPGINRVIREERECLDRLINECKIDVVISDNRFGLNSSKIHSVFITHQLFLKTPFAARFARKINQNYILNFDEVWVPDFEKEPESLSGSLSHGNQFHNNIKYIGPLSRLQKAQTKIKYDRLFLVSGPEPQRTIFANKCLNLVKKNPVKQYAFVSPTRVESNENNVTFFVSPTAAKLSEIICSSQQIVCRSGYSTLMDLYTLEKKDILLVPTPGQTEQEYLAELWKTKFDCKVVSQSQL